MITKVCHRSEVTGVVENILKKLKSTVIIMDYASHRWWLRQKV